MGGVMDAWEVDCPKCGRFAITYMAHKCLQEGIVDQARVVELGSAVRACVGRGKLLFVSTSRAGGLSEALASRYCPETL